MASSCREQRLWTERQADSEERRDYQVSSWNGKNRQKMNQTESLECFTRKLTRGVEGPLARLRVIFTWVATNIAYDVDAFIRGRHTPRDTQKGSDVLQLRKATCSGYSDLLQCMSRVAGIECRKIQGHVKGAGYLPGHVFSPDLPNHEWNAVLLNDHWYLLDVCWSSGYIQQTNKQFVFKFSDHYFLTDPEVFAEDHLPLDSSWQLLENPRNLEDFQTAVHLKQGFFQYGICEVFPERGYVMVDEEQDVSLCYPFPLTLTYELKHLELDREFSKCVHFRITNSKADFCIRPPISGLYTFRVYGKLKGCKDEPVALTTHTLEVVSVCPVVPSWTNLRFPWGPTRHLTNYSLEEVGSSRSCLTLEDGACENTFKYNPHSPVLLKPILYKSVNGKLKGCASEFSVVFQGTDSNCITVRTTPPSPGHFWLTIYSATPEGILDDSSECVANYMICSKASEFRRGGEYPEAARWRHKCQDTKTVLVPLGTSGDCHVKSQTAIYDKSIGLATASDAEKALGRVVLGKVGLGRLGSLANLLLLLCARIRDQSHKGYLRLLRFVID